MIDPFPSETAFTDANGKLTLEARRWLQLLLAQIEDDEAELADHESRITVLEP